MATNSFASVLDASVPIVLDPALHFDLTPINHALQGHETQEISRYQWVRFCSLAGVKYHRFMPLQCMFFRYMLKGQG